MENIETVLLDDLRLDDNNARRHSERNIKAIAESLKQFGQRKPIVVTKDNVVIAGNGTLEAARSIGWKALNVVRIPEDWDTQRIKAYALADNRTAELATWNGDLLMAQLEELNIDNWDINALGFKEFEMKIADENADTSPQDIAERYEVIIECADENEQTALLLRLSQEGLRVRAIII